MPGRRICIFGGTFDPIHKAHVRIATEAKAKFLLDEVWFVPAANPPHKEAAGLAPYEDRVRMVEIALKGKAGLVVSRLEEGSGRSYTVDTLERVRHELTPHDQLFFLIGADAFDEIETWHCWERVIQLADFIVVQRPGKQYHVPAGARVHRLSELELPVSSSTVRNRLANGKPTPELDDAVRAYITEHGLY
jgi:nicotinate-nucleotide adenylyltransferase